MTDHSIFIICAYGVTFLGSALLAIVTFLRLSQMRHKLKLFTNDEDC